jgi:hypothetical protein
MKRSNKPAVEALISTMIEIGKRVTSHDYILLVLQTLIAKLDKKHPALKNIHIKTTSYSSSSGELIIDDSIDKIPDKELAMALEALIKEISAPCRGPGTDENQFLLMIKGYIGRPVAVHLATIGVKSLS